MGYRHGVVGTCPRCRLRLDFESLGNTCPGVDVTEADVEHWLAEITRMGRASPIDLIPFDERSGSVGDYNTRSEDSHAEFLRLWVVLNRLESQRLIRRTDFTGGVVHFSPGWFPEAAQ